MAIVFVTVLYREQYKKMFKYWVDITTKCENIYIVDLSVCSLWVSFIGVFYVFRTVYSLWCLRTKI